MEKQTEQNQGMLFHRLRIVELQTVGSELDNASLTSDQQNQLSSNNEMFRKEAAGCLGLVERIPLGIKLCISTSVAALILLFFGAWLIGLYGLQTTTALQANHFLEAYSSMSGYLFALQRSRFMLADHATKGTNTTAKNWQSQSQFVVGNETEVNRYFAAILPTASALLSKQILRTETFKQQWPSVSAKILDRTMDGLEAYNWVCNYIEALLGIFTVFIQESALLRSTQAFDMYARLRNSAGKLRSFGTLAFNNKNVALNAMFQSTFVEFITKRETLEDLFSVYASPDVYAQYERTVLNIPGNLVTMQFERTALNASASNFHTSVNPTFWSNNMSLVVDALQAMYPSLYDQAYAQIQTQIRSSIASIVVIVVLVIVAFVLFWLFSILFAQTIIGPYVANFEYHNL